MMWVVVALVTVLMVMAGSARKLVPGKLQSMAEMLVDFIRGIIWIRWAKRGCDFSLWSPPCFSLFCFVI